MSIIHVKNDHDIKNDNGDHLISGGKYIFSKEEYSKWVKSLKNRNNDPEFLKDHDIIITTYAILAQSDIKEKSGSEKIGINTKKTDKKGIFEGGILYLDQCLDASQTK
ncbi:hypothetical protein RirG_166260 [Rhizophagus irregularis DAOM 197198w]|uniref:Uncharacterized protein n=1 Tax=Rhizophagus irregularis (strain DAOM 197198w) TaxID=1432141 RepID=A0A015IXF0_RHIIW|nr:hypothetical protein RirG_166260 [Rhizophagus irregularis DAOM 197198w]